MPVVQVLLLGFSQGGALALTLGLQSPHVLAGLAILSSYLPRPADYTAEGLRTPDKRGLPVDFYHGTADHIVRLAWGKAAHSRLTALGLNRLTFTEYAKMEHTVCRSMHACKLRAVDEVV
jgi:phospholipase/carboxylesterase